jgi:murein DD-endopeptidase MepM/ murein hydrolase activator NlpD
VNIDTVAEIVLGRRSAEREGGRAARAEAGANDSDHTRARLTQLAAEFESMLLLQMLKEMRKASTWGDEEGAESSGYGAETMLETIDVELASHLSKVQGFGLAKQLLRALDPKATSVERGAQPAREREPADQSGMIETPAGHVTSAFGWRLDPIHGAARFHRGIDIRAAYGQDVQAAGAGRVVSAGTEGGYGETVVIEHPGGLRTRYAHLSAAMVTPGQEIRAGQVVGRAGRSGRATGTHLHFEITTATGDRVDPADFARFKGAGVVADLTGGTSPAAVPPGASARQALQETRRHDDTN